MAISFDPEGYAYKCWEVIGNKEYAIGKINNEGRLMDINEKILNRHKFDNGHNCNCTFYKGYMAEFLKIHIARKKAIEFQSTNK